MGYDRTESPKYERTTVDGWIDKFVAIDPKPRTDGKFEFEHVCKEQQ